MSITGTNEVGSGRWSADLRTTTHGVVHVRADDWGGLGLGQGWACARDHLAVVAEQIVKVRGERAKFFGPGPIDAHTASDLGYRMLGLRDRAAAFLDAQPAHLRELIEGYTAGYNLRVAEVLDGAPVSAWAEDAEWVRPITVEDLATYLQDVAMMASGRNVAQLIGRAEAPGPDGPQPPSPIEALGGAQLASNGWAVGGDVSASGGGMVLSNPHFPWYGEARFWECHLTVPGEYDVYGVSLLGTPGIQMGFNDSLAWTHTFSVGHRFTLYRLDLDPTDPTAYRYGDNTRAMTSEEHIVEVLGADPVTRTLWRTHYGPMLNMPLLGWGTELAFTYRDANIDNTAVVEHFLEMGRARSVAELRSVFDRVKGIPWVNTMAADSAGDALYIDGSATPRLTPEADARYVERNQTDFIAMLLSQNRIALLDGSDPGDEWQDHPDARSPGLEPPSRYPAMERRDAMVNANDSHWSTHWSERLTGFPSLAGMEATPRSLRTRMNLLRARELSERGGVTNDDLLGTVFDNVSYSAVLLRDAVVDRCRAAGTVTAEGHEADLVAVADVLAAWGGTTGLDDPGAALWRELVAGFPKEQRLDAGGLFAVGFDPADIVGTPHTLTPATEGGIDPVVQAAGHAARVLTAAGLPLDASFRDCQWADRGGVRVPVHGGTESDGVMNVLDPVVVLPPMTLEPAPPQPTRIAGRDATGLAQGGYSVVYGASFLMSVDMTTDGPVGVGLLAYGQNEDPRSPHHVDGTVAFSEQAVRPLRFTDDDVEADPELTRRTITGG
jgi:acyl-homoserine-lactone acylase